MNPAGEVSHILIVDDDPAAARGHATRLRLAGHAHVLTECDPRLVERSFEEHRIAVVLLDLMMPHRSGEEVLAWLREQQPATLVIVVTAVNDIERAVHCMRLGAADYLVKPVEETRMLAAVQRALDAQTVRDEYAAFRARAFSGRIERPAAFAKILTHSARMHAIFQYCETVAPSQSPVLILGETGTGKELLARAIHDAHEPQRPFVAVNLGGLDEQLFSDTLFGHVKGAFTGADQPRRGLIEAAAGGTLFLDEIGDLPMPVQVRLLRLLEAGEYYPLGADAPRRSTARILTATHRDLQTLVQLGDFRRDLYYRLCAHQIEIPPLRERREDLPLLCEAFLADAAQALGKAKPTAPPELFLHLAGYGFPGNVRELRAMISHAVAQHPGRVLSLHAFDRWITGPALETHPAREGFPGLDLDESFPTIETLTNRLVAEALRRAQGNQTVAARLLGISRTTLNKRLRKDSDSAR